MDITERKITKIAREAEMLVLRTLREEGVGTAEIDLIHALRHHPGCTQAALAELKPLMAGGSGEKLGRACIGTVRGDMHDIGKNLVKIMMEGSGIEVVDLGVDVSPEQFVETALAQDCGVIACSSLLTTTMQEMRDVVRLAEEKGIRDRVKIFVGGAPISQSFCDEIGADVYTEDAAAAARAAALREDK